MFIWRITKIITRKEFQNIISQGIPTKRLSKSWKIYNFPTKNRQNLPPRISPPPPASPSDDNHNNKADLPLGLSLSLHLPASLPEYLRYLTICYVNKFHWKTINRRSASVRQTFAINIRSVHRGELVLCERACCAELCCACVRCSTEKEKNPTGKHSQQDYLSSCGIALGGFRLVGLLHHRASAIVTGLVINY